MRTFAYILGFILNIMLYGGAREVGGLEFWQAFALLAVLNFVAILLHELGHAWAFLHVGGSVQKIVVMFLTYDAPKRRLSFSNRLIGSDIGGYVAGRYANDRPTVGSAIIVAAGGPVVNAISGALALMAAVLLSPQTLDNHSSWSDYPAWEAARAEVVAAGEIPPDRSPAYLPTEDEIAAITSRLDVSESQHEFSQFTYTSLLLFGALSLGLALLNLLPYGGSDGQLIARAIKQWRMMGGGRRR